MAEVVADEKKNEEGICQINLWTIRRDLHPNVESRPGLSLHLAMASKEEPKQNIFHSLIPNSLTFPQNVR
ncbi:MAG: hypothetical protein DI598_10580 [Pseudopedobacter saltans]|uniref:Uncharacterized protein n=1 Tax=Pseudopedobacter saltans TaxID=151895 RepID=A0A2W5F130_9SPHI|nr:MAG: hypothetical protein DI598_10580 [Pseudopedobacter saltans]